MTPAARQRRQVRVPILLLCGTAWMLLVFEPGGAALMSHCSAAMFSQASLGQWFAMNPPGPLALGWAVMLAAMMAPLQIAPVRHVRDSSLARRRARGIALYVAGYTAVWMGVGAILMAVSMAVRLAAPESYVPLAVVGLAALVWQFSPAKQRCLNRGHAHPPLAAFGRAADIDAVHFGLTHALWCAGSCWALMLWPLLFSRGHVAAMAVVTLWLVAERLDRPKPPHWRIRGPAKGVRIALALVAQWPQTEPRT